MAGAFLPAAFQNDAFQIDAADSITLGFVMKLCPNCLCIEVIDRYSPKCRCKKGNTRYVSR